MLTTRNGEDHLGLPAYRLSDRRIGCGVAGVQGDGEIDVSLRRIAGDVTDFKSQPFAAKFVSDALAVSDDIRLQIEFLIFLLPQQVLVGACLR